MKKRTPLYFSLLTILGLVLLLLSPWGASLTIRLANNLLPELQADYRSGGLLSTIELNALRWQDAQTDLQVDDLQLGLNWSCAIDFELCVDVFKIKRLTTVVSAKDSVEESPATGEVIRMPLPVKLENLQIGQLDVTVENLLRLSWRELNSSLDFYQKLNISHLSITDLQVDLLQDTSTTKAAPEQVPFDFVNWQYQPLQLPGVILPVEFNIQQLDIAPLSLQLPDADELVLGSVALKAKGSGSNLELTNLAVTHGQGNLQAQAKVRLQDNYPHQLNMTLNSIDPEYGNISVQVSSIGDLSDLRAELKLSGDRQMNIKVKADLSSELLPVELTANWQELGWPLNQAEFASHQGQFSAIGDLSGLQVEGDLDLAASNIPPMVITVSMFGDRKSVSIQQLVAKLLDGELRAQGQLAIGHTLDWQGDINLQHINPGSFWPDTDADINGSVLTAMNYSTANLHAELSELALDGIWRERPLTATGGAIYDSQVGLSIDNVELLNGDNKLSVSGSMDNEQNLALQINLLARELAQSIPLVKGQINVEAQAQGTLSQPRLSFITQGQNLELLQWQTSQLNGSGELTWDDIKPMDMQLTLSGISDGEITVDDFVVSLTGNAAAHQLSLDASGSQAKLIARLSGQLFEHQWQGQWLHGDVQSDYANLILAEPFNIEADWQNQRYQISPHCWQQQQSSLCIKQAEYSGQQASWDLEIENLAIVPLIARHIPAVPVVKSSSALSLTLNGQWNGQGLPQANLHAELSPAVWHFKQQQVELDLQKLSVDADLGATNAQLQLHFSGPRIGQVDMEMNVDPQPGERKIDGRVLVKALELQPFAPLLPQLQTFAGRISADTKILGSLNKPLLSGMARLDDGALEGEGIPIKLTQLTQQITLSGQKADFDGGYKLGEGTGTMQGQLDWSSQLSGKLAVNGDDLEIDYQSILRAKVSPRIQLAFAPDIIELKGEISVPYARFKLRELPPSAISPSKDVVLIDQQVQQSPLQQKLDMHLMVKVDPDRRDQVKLDAFGLTSDLYGELLLRQDKQTMLGNGEMRLVNGRYRAYGQNLLIREGELLFSGPVDRPYLTVDAVRDPKLTADEVIAGIRIQGLVDKPEASIFSEPAMEQKESLSYLLTGHATSSKSGDNQNTMLANALLGFGLGKSKNTVSSLGSKLGVNDLNLETSGQGKETQLNISGYIAPGVQLRYGVGVFDSPSEVALRYELLPQLYLEAVSGVNNALDLYYRFSLGD